MARVHVIIPALNEEASLPGVLHSLRAVPDVDVLVVDNGSRDGTSTVAARYGATVVHEPRRGYGSACLAGLAALRDAPDRDIVAFVDADGSDDPALVGALVAPLDADEADFVLASRTLVPGEHGALTPAQRTGNLLACRLIAWRWRVRYTDLAPCRALRLGSLRRLRMDDRDFGWTVQMQIRAARAGLRCHEIPSRYRNRRAGRSKVSGSVRGSVRAALTILRVIGAEARR